MGILTDIEAKLIADTVGGGVTDWLIELSQFNEEGDLSIGLFETGGELPDSDEAADSDATIDVHEFPDFQVIVRGEASGYEVARAKMDDVINSLQNATITGFTYVFMKSSVLPLGLDDNNRPLISLNFKSMKVL